MTQLLHLCRSLRYLVCSGVWLNSQNIVESCVLHHCNEEAALFWQLALLRLYLPPCVSSKGVPSFPGCSEARPQKLTTVVAAKKASVQNKDDLPSPQLRFSDPQDPLLL